MRRLLFIACSLLLLVSCAQKEYRQNTNFVFGTIYNITYQSDRDLQQEIEAELMKVDGEFSMFNPQSTVARINSGDSTVERSEMFNEIYQLAQTVSKETDGAFDITVAPLVKAFGFGRKSDQVASISSQTIDSIRAFVGFEKVQLVDHKVVKDDPRVQIDGGAVAKGQACDMIAEVLREHGCTNYLVDIGGEVVAHGVNDKGQAWHIGITKPNINNEGAQEELQEILAVSDICMATSGNYRNYYYADGERRSHTIDPRTGYPVQHSLFSATVVSSTCMRADALATACMVLGAEEALAMIARAEDAACYFIVAQNDSLVTITSPNWEEFIKK